MKRISAAIGAVCLILTACGGGSTDTATPVDGEGFFDGLASVWSADRLDDRSYGIRIEFNGSTDIGSVIATVAYPGLDCAGEWRLTEADDTSITVSESVPINPDDACTDGGSAELARAGTTLDYQWFYPSGQPSDTGTLYEG
jgi:hypothetical protein